MRLTINNSLCRIEGTSPDQYKQLRELLSYSPDTGGYFVPGRPNKRYLIDKKGNFPSGLLNLVEEYLAPVSSQVQVTDLRAKPNPKFGIFNLTLPFEPYEEQVEVSEICGRKYRGCVSAVTGFGKSVAMALLVNRLQVRTLIVVPNLSLKTQLQASFKQYFGTLNNITIENIDSAVLTTATDYDCLIIDEAHHAAAATYRKLNLKAWNNIYYRFFFTATPYRSRDEERLLLESVTGQVIYTVSYQTAVDKGYITPVEAYYFDLPVTEMRGNPRSWPAVYSELVVNNEVRNALIAKLIAQIDAPTLTLVKEIKHGEILSEMTATPFANGQGGNTQILLLEFNLGETRSLIGTTGVLGEGTDSKPAEWIILAAGGKSKNQFLQNCGRGVRTYPGKESCKVIMFRDASNPFLLKHFKACVNHLRDEYHVKPVKLEIAHI